ncbi:MAG: hypothetical protein LBQ60_20905 [Bacteroidales bacterium]|jgi:hypothetical protein|nr:hypothetical protein [Bacteroidales bacterium]
MMFVAPLTSKAQVDYSLGADIVSSYIWRGSHCAGTSIQPSMGLSVGGFSIGTWGSVDVGGFGLKEVDLTLGYSIGGFSIGLSDYWWNGEEAYDYFRFKKDSSSHMLEVNLGYEFGFGLSLSWNTMVAGAQDKYPDDDGDIQRAFSTYIEAGYSFSIKSIDLTASLGFSPWKSDVMYTAGYAHATDGFAITNISLLASKEISITERFSLPVFTQLTFNPAKEDVFLVFGFSF